MIYEATLPSNSSSTALLVEQSTRYIVEELLVMKKASVNSLLVTVQQKTNTQNCIRNDL